MLRRPVFWLGSLLTVSGLGLWAYRIWWAPAGPLCPITPRDFAPFL